MGTGNLGCRKTGNRAVTGKVKFEKKTGSQDRADTLHWFPPISFHGDTISDFVKLSELGSIWKSGKLRSRWVIWLNRLWSWSVWFIKFNLNNLISSFFLLILLKIFFLFIYKVRTKKSTSVDDYRLLLTVLCKVTSFKVLFQVIENLTQLWMIFDIRNGHYKDRNIHTVCNNQWGANGGTVRVRYLYH